MANEKAFTLTVKDTCFRYISDSSCFHNISDDKFLNGLVLGDAAGTVGAADGLHMATPFLGTAVIPSLLGLFKGKGYEDMSKH